MAEPVEGFICDSCHAEFEIELLQYATNALTDKVTSLHAWKLAPRYLTSAPPV